jgi:hypothetical protein
MLSKHFKIFILPILFILIAVEPNFFIIPFDYVFDIHDTHLSLGGWLSILILMLAVFYDFFTFLYCLKHSENNKYLVPISLIFLISQFLLSGWELGFWR